MAGMKRTDIDHGRAFDWGRASEDYAKYRDIYPASFYAKLREAGIGLAGQRVLDLGTGTGVLPRAMYSHGARFTGVDISPEQIEQARALSAGMEIEYIAAPAEDIDFTAGSFDAAAAITCFWYMDRDVVLLKLHGMLKEKGRFAICSMAWLPAESDIAQGSEALVLKYNPAWMGANWAKRTNSLPEPEWAAPLFRVHQNIVFHEALPFTRENWHGRMLACRGIGASSLTTEEIAAFEAEHIAYMQTLPEQFTVMHQVEMLVLEKNE